MKSMPFFCVRLGADEQFLSIITRFFLEENLQYVKQLMTWSIKDLLSKYKLEGG